MTHPQAKPPSDRRPINRQTTTRTTQIKQMQAVESSFRTGKMATTVWGCGSAREASLKSREIRRNHSQHVSQSANTIHRHAHPHATRSEGNATCWGGGMPSFSSTRSLILFTVSVGSMSNSISFPAHALPRQPHSTMTTRDIGQGEPVSVLTLICIFLLVVVVWREEGVGHKASRPEFQLFPPVFRSATTISPKVYP